MCIVGYVLRCDCGHWSHPDHTPTGCRHDCDCDILTTPHRLEIPPELPPYVRRYLDDPAWRERWVPTLRYP